MKKKMVLILGGALVLCAVAGADAIMPNVVTIQGPEAGQLFDKIQAVTGNPPTVIRGRSTVSAQANIACYNLNGTTVCRIAVSK